MNEKQKCSGLKLASFYKDVKKEFVLVRVYQVPEQKKFSTAVCSSRKMPYINENQSIFKCFESMPKYKIDNTKENAFGCMFCSIQIWFAECK